MSATLVIDQTTVRAVARSMFVGDYTDPDAATAWDFAIEHAPNITEVIDYERRARNALMGYAEHTGQTIL